MKLVKKYQNGGISKVISSNTNNFLPVTSNFLPEVIVKGYRPIELKTYYPLGKDYPYTGHSELNIPITIEAANKFGLYHSDIPEKDKIKMPYNIRIDKRSSADDYNLVTNNCADATLEYLNSIFGTKESPYLFTTPGDVRDYAINVLKGKVVKKDGIDTVLIPRNKNNATRLSEKALKKYKQAEYNDENSGTAGLRLQTLDN